MKKSLIYIPLVALALASCDRTQDLIFDGSAAERLEQGKQDAIATLTADGGLWAMEYFANSDEHGYVMLTRFSKDGSVEVSVNHEWQANPYQFSQATSLWDIVSDNGTVLSFCTENPLFHVFSDPENITGPYAPTNPDLNTDIDETGYGHEGDYEFLVMTSEDPNTVRLLGKKRGFNIYLRKLPADTDEKTYLEGLTEKVNASFNSKFPTMILTDKLGREYEVNDLNDGTPSMFPRSVYGATGELLAEGDAITQTTSSHGIFTYSGFRFAKTYSPLHADGSNFDLYEFNWAEDGSLVNEEEGLRIAAPTPVENFGLVSYSWTVDPESFTGQFAEKYAKADADVLEALGTKNKLGVIEFNWAMLNKEMTHLLLTRLGSKRCQDFFATDANKGEELGVTYLEGNSTADRYNEEIPSLWEFKQLFFSNLVFENAGAMDPATVHVHLASDPESGFTINVQ